MPCMHGRRLPCMICQYTPPRRVRAQCGGDPGRGGFVINTDTTIIMLIPGTYVNKYATLGGGWNGQIFPPNLNVVGFGAR